MKNILSNKFIIFYDKCHICQFLHKFHISSIKISPTTKHLLYNNEGLNENNY